jgi:hypothetical protein
LGRRHLHASKGDSFPERLSDPTSAAIAVDGVDLRSFDVEAWRQRVAVVFQDFVRFELSLRDNLLPARTGGTVEDSVILAAKEPICPEANGSESPWLEHCLLCAAKPKFSSAC